MPKGGNKALADSKKEQTGNPKAKRMEQVKRSKMSKVGNVERSTSPALFQSLSDQQTYVSELQRQHDPKASQAQSRLDKAVASTEYPPAERDSGSDADSQDGCDFRP